MIFHRILLCGLLLVIASACTTSKWTVVDEHAINPAESAEVVAVSELLLAEELPTIENPVLTLSPYRVEQREYTERIQIQRMVQEYRPKWGFAVLAAAGSVLSFTAANSGYLISSPSTTQQVSLNAVGVFLGTLAATNLRESGDPIQTDESRFLRQSGTDLRTDTLSIQQTIDQTASISVLVDDEEVFYDSTVQLSGNKIELNLGALAAEFSGTIMESSTVTVTSELDGNASVHTIDVLDFMEHRFIIQDPVAQLRSSPTITQDNIIAELGEGSSLKQLELHDDQWVRVEYGSVEAYALRTAGETALRSTAESGPALLVELSDIPFGEIDVENSLPILKSNNPNDRAIVISGNRNNLAGIRQYTERDARLFRHYMRTSLRMENDQIIELESPGLSEWPNELQFCRNLTGGSVVVYLSGFARYPSDDSDQQMVMYHLDEDGNEETLPLYHVMEELARCGAEKLFVFVDLEYVREGEEGRMITQLNGNSRRQQQLANRLLERFPNAFVLFGNRVGQRSSLYRGSVEEDMRHHLFPYYLADALKQRRTRMSDLFRHLENNVDYTSRRLHDRPQEVQGFGNFMLDISQ
ncbi:hypothetical protein [Rhodohalobacter sp. SW132]|uniref:hypothetical protein n=1 Tax=Rhodohalobacter sp. SW132 TaxID=2293433 RepID=UPI000E26A2B4|nr:hypothetical protein [Rhodohalobacter sp. SW132]